MAGGTVATVGGLAVCAGLLCILKTAFKKKGTSVKSKVVLITGASSGLGEACAHAFYQAGAKVILAARRVTELERVANDLRSSSAGAAVVHDPKILVLDLEDLQSIPKVAKNALEYYGHVDILINNGGISYRGQATETTLEVDIKVMTVNYFGQVALTKALLPSMIARQQGHVVAVSSVQGKFAIPYRSPYCASKHALQAFFDTLRAEVAQQNVQVSVISPGYIQSNLSVNAVTESGAKYGVMDSTTQSGMKADEVAKKVLHTVMYGSQEVVLAPLLHRIVIVIRALFPSLFFYIMRLRARKQRKEIEKRK